eukprot:SAG31_NODE_17146_length_681_cov_2.084192_1_plen_85_part_00
MQREQRLAAENGVLDQLLERIIASAHALEDATDKSADSMENPVFDDSEEEPQESWTKLEDLLASVIWHVGTLSIADNSNIHTKI